MGCIVVGVDGSPSSRAALRWAAAEAQRWGATLRAIETWEFNPLTAITGGPTDVAEIREAAAHKLDRTIREELGDDAAAGIEQVVVEDSPVNALLAAGGEADLLVVGSRGSGGFKGLLLGSVSQQVSHHAPCPVVIVPAPATSS
jgi:nucleotide-binding universal stress UspA family protein